MTARRAGLVACNSCGKLDRLGAKKCRRCHAHLHSRYPKSIQRTIAWLLTGIVFYIPANMYPMLITETVSGRYDSTIIGGVITLVEYKSYFVAAVVGIASVMVPVSKFIIISLLVASILRAWPLNPHSRLRLYEITEFIGRWSMIDVYVVAVLTALVQLGFVASMHPGVAPICFAASVIFTMLSAQSLDPRLIWDDYS